MTRHNRPLLFALALSGCYIDELDPNISGVFVCSDDIECALGQECLDGVCVSTAGLEGPTVQIVAPQQLAVFPMGDTSALPLIVAGKDLHLGVEESDDALAGYIEIELDGAVVDAVVEGPLEDGIELGSLPLPQTPGLHHIRVVARRADGELFDTDHASATIGFWVDDGKEHIGILEPPPSARIPLGDGLRVEVASLNFTFVNPGFIGPEDADTAGLGYANLYIDADIPTCLPGCNPEYDTSVIPAGLSRVNRIISEQPIVFEDNVGIVRLQVVGESLSHTPYLQDGGTGAVVFHSIPIQTVVGATP